MSEIEWSRTKKFSKSEWPTGVTLEMAPRLFHELFKLRDGVPSDHYITPSPLPEGHVRFSGASRHSTRKGIRLSDATDVFLPNWTVALRVWQKAQQLNFGGIGLYTDTHLHGKPTPMMHLDMRSNRLMWVRSAEHGYVYFVNNPQLFLKILSDHVN